jgi:hypothetical protein
VFLKYGVLLVGLGDPGEYLFKSAEYHQYSFVKMVAEDIEYGDTVVLKKPFGRKWGILAVGKIISQYIYRPQFDDVSGWDLQHSKSVDWYKPNKSLDAVSDLRRGTCSRVKNRKIREIADSVLATGNRVDIKPIPDMPDLIENKEIIEELVDHGLSSRSAEEVGHSIRRVQRLAKWYMYHGHRVSEYEARSLLVVPMLLALGWPEQKLKIEWDKLDIAFFDKPYRGIDEKCIMILESKSPGSGLIHSENQVRTYADKYKDCKKIIISDGIRYIVFERKNGEWKRLAYLNLLKPRKYHPFEPSVEGALAVLTSLMPG